MSSIEAEFAAALLNDPRRTSRLVQLAQQLSDAPDVGFPQVLQPAKLEAAYRFFRNAAVEFEAILAPHIAMTAKRAESDEVTLALHDTTTLSFGNSGGRQGITPSSSGAQQLLAHTTLAVSGDGTRRPHGVVALTTHQLENEPRVHDRWLGNIRAGRAALCKSNVIDVMDREADDYEILALCERFVVRAQHDRKLNGTTKMSGKLVMPAVAERTVALGKRGKAAGEKQRKIHPPRAARLASLTFTAASVEIPRPRCAPEELPKSRLLNLVRVSEPAPPEGEKAIEWLLLTTEPIATNEDVLKIVDWYRTRWLIEEYFKALKTGCAIEKRQLVSLHALRNALAVFTPIAWQLLLLRTESRERAQEPATTVLSDDQLTVLRLGGRKKLPPAPTVRDALLAVAALGGHLAHNGDPGWLTLARGLEKLDTLVEGWRLHASTTAPIEGGTTDQS